ncbi:hypothetical protein SAMN05421863_11083 [Nitrosomonas communis]|uniref:Helix-turn-helix domain-containing protein n=1 Tax=Nitrosomonas communis TaxID=44574 RepID=A0A1I4WGF5_9PROT|nr:hypothetical protein SAMN05421863_11083 [Nitrosomonas communis]
MADSSWQHNFYKASKRQAVIASELLKRSNKRVRIKHCHQIAQEQRAQVCILREAGFKQGKIANETGLYKCTILRELRRNGEQRGRCLKQAQELLDKRMR